MGPSGRSYDFFWTPICLSGPREAQEVAKALEAFQNLGTFGGAYLQTRVALDEMPAAYSFRKHHLSYRTTFQLDTFSSETDWFNSMKRDSRSRFKKALALIQQKNVVIQNYLDFKTIDPKILISCHEIYIKTSEIKNFHDQYKFEYKDFVALLTSNLWYLSTLTCDGEVLGFSIIGNTTQNLDYTFAASKITQYDVGRMLILNAFRLGQRYQKSVCLGGGISEGDALEDFKHRMGTTPVQFANVKLIGNHLLDDIGDDNFSNLELQRWPNV